MPRGVPGDPSAPASIFVSTGSTSSDVQLTPVLRELKRRGVIASITALGGAPLLEVGAELILDTTPTSSIGFMASVASAVRHWRLVRHAPRVKEYFRHQRPDLVILVDNFGINWRVLRFARSQGVPVLYFIPPELWSIWPWDLQAIVREATMIAPIWPSEADAYRRRGGCVHCVGHPLLDIVSEPARSTARPTATPTIGVFPGSRWLEVRELLAPLRDAAERIRERLPGARFIMCSANEATQELIRSHLPSWRVPVESVHRDSLGVLARCDLLLTCSGTATLEAALAGVPMVVLYRLHHALDVLLGFIKLYRGRWPFLALPNRILDRAVVPELVNHAVQPDRIANEALSLLTNLTRRHAMINELAQVRAALGPPGAIQRTADLVEEMLRAASHPRRRELATTRVGRHRARWATGNHATSACQIESAVAGIEHGGVYPAGMSCE